MEENYRYLRSFKLSSYPKLVHTTPNPQPPAEAHEGFMLVMLRLERGLVRSWGSQESLESLWTTRLNPVAPRQLIEVRSTEATLFKFFCIRSGPFAIYVRLQSGRYALRMEQLRRWAGLLSKSNLNRPIFKALTKKNNYHGLGRLGGFHTNT